MKKTYLGSLILKTAYFTLPVTILSMGLFLLDTGLISRWAGLMILFFFTITVAGLGLIISKYHRNPDSFSRYYFIVMLLRLFLGILFVWAGLLLIKENRIIFVVNFLVLYLLFLGFEIYYLIANFQSGTSKD